MIDIANASIADVFAHLLEVQGHSGMNLDKTSKYGYALFPNLRLRRVEGRRSLPRAVPCLCSAPQVPARLGQDRGADGAALRGVVPVRVRGCNPGGTCGQDRAAGPGWR